MAVNRLDEEDIEQMGELKAKLDIHSDKLDSIDSELKAMNINFAKYNEQLVFHIQRSNKLEDLYQVQVKEIDKRLSPIEKHVIQVGFLGKIALAGVAFPAAIYYIAQLVRMLMGKI